jgi:hypothetical protein
MNLLFIFSFKVLEVLMSVMFRKHTQHSDIPSQRKLCLVCCHTARARARVVFPRNCNLKCCEIGYLYSITVDIKRCLIR